MRGDSARVVSASHAVLACYNVMIPYIVKDLPKEQAGALAQQKKEPVDLLNGSDATLAGVCGSRNWTGYVAGQ